MRLVGARVCQTCVLRAFAILLGALAILSWSPGTFAHASLTASTPTAGAVLSQGPATVRLTFNEPVSPLILKIIQPDGAVHDIARTKVLSEGLELEVPLPRLDRQGAYGLSWRVVSADGHPIGGTLTFSVGVEGASPALEPSASSGRSVLIWLSRLAGYIGLFFGIGLAVGRALNAMEGDKRPLALGLLALAAGATLFNVGLLGLDALDKPAAALVNTDPWRTAFSTSFGLSAAMALAGLTCAAFVWYTRSQSTRRWLAVTALILLGAALAASGHASSAPPTWLARPAIWLHVVAMTLWIGLLLPLACSLAEPADLRLLRRFSRQIPVVLLILLFSGGILVYLQFDMPSSLWLTAYGQVLGVKLLLVAALLGLGAFNRYRLTRAVLGSQLSAQRAMRRIIYVECLVAVVILAVVALWRFTPPPRALSSTSAIPAAASADMHSAASAHIHSAAAMADLLLERSIPGQPATLNLYLSKADLTPLAAQEVDIVFSNSQAGIEPIVFSAKRVDDITWQVENIELPSLPRWHVRIDALVSDFERISLEGSLDFQNQMEPK
ncbi:copper resistance protein CopC [Parapusillimonas sp. SGNA-6]|nr:copper resistance protein CopC [Parapusillimonas sp. SGNA-6]